MVVHKTLRDVSHEHAFWFHHGVHVFNAVQLRDTLEAVSDAEFSLYANLFKNDFYNWMKDVVGDRVLVQQFEHCIDRQQMIQYLSERIQGLQRRGPVASPQKVRSSPKNVLKKSSLTKQAKSISPHKGIQQQQLSSYKQKSLYSPPKLKKNDEILKELGQMTLPEVVKAFQEERHVTPEPAVVHFSKKATVYSQDSLVDRMKQVYRR